METTIALLKSRKTDKTVSRISVINCNNVFDAYTKAREYWFGFYGPFEFENEKDYRIETSTVD